MAQDAAITANHAPDSPVEVRALLAEALDLDLIGPWAGHELAEERLPGYIRPSNWYLTGFLIPSGSPPEKSADADEDDDLDVPGPGGLAEESSEDRKAAKKGFFPSSMGLSFLVTKETRALEVTVRWGDYEVVAATDEEAEADGADKQQDKPHDKPEDKPENTDGEEKPAKLQTIWRRRQREEKIPLRTEPGHEATFDVPASGGLQIHVLDRTIQADRWLSWARPSGPGATAAGTRTKTTRPTHT